MNESKRTRKTLSWINTALGSVETLTNHTDAELSKVIEACKNIIAEAEKVRKQNVDKEIADMEARIAELKKLKEAE